MANRDRFDAGTDNPPHSRVFIIAGKGVKEEEYKETFSKFGDVEDVWMVKDRRTSEEKGITYIKFSRASEAALAVEEMHGKTLGSNPKPIKVIIASSRKDGNVRDPREEEKLVRLFVVCPKKFTEDDLKVEFKQYGDIDYVQIVRDRSSGENKGFGYIKYHRPYHAAVALESCDPSFRPKFAEPKARRGDREERDEYERRYDRYDSGYSNKRMYPDPAPFDPIPMQMDDRSPRGFGLGMPQTVVQQQLEHQMRSAAQGGGLSPAEMIQSYPSTNCQRLHITAPLGMTQSYLSRLFNLIPGLEYCDLNEQSGIAYARYQSSQCAAYAHDKLDGFEYPIGSRLIVRYADAQPPADLAPANMNMKMLNPGMLGPQATSPMAGSSGAFQRAAELLEQAGIDPGEVLACGVERVRYCSLMLPLPQPLRHEGTECRVRLFIVCQPSSIPEKILKDAFCRFGNLIDVFLLGGRNYGYAKYADKASAEKAMETLHGQTLAGNRLKVLEADPPKDDSQRNDRDHHRDSHRRDDRDRENRREDMSGVEESPNKKQRT